MIPIHKNILINNLDGELWVECKDFPLYMVSNMGRVKSVERKISVKSFHGRLAYETIRKSKILIQDIDKWGYLKAWLYDKTWQKGKKGSLVHRLVAIAFLPNPENKKEVNHKFGDKKDCRAESLEWATPKENRNHAIDTGLWKSMSNENHPMALFTNKEVKKIRQLYIDGHKISHIVKKYPQSKHGNIWSIVHNKTYKEV